MNEIPWTAVRRNTKTERALFACSLSVIFVVFIATVTGSDGGVGGFSHDYAYGGGSILSVLVLFIVLISTISLNVRAEHEPSTINNNMKHVMAIIWDH